MRGEGMTQQGRVCRTTQRSEVSRRIERDTGTARRHQLELCSLDLIGGDAEAIIGTPGQVSHYKYK